jgi:hypothetical protein
MTELERRIWSAAYAASYIHQIYAGRYSPPRAALMASGDANEAVRELREIQKKHPNVGSRC